MRSLGVCHYVDPKGSVRIVEITKDPQYLYSRL